MRCTIVSIKFAEWTWLFHPMRYESQVLNMYEYYIRVPLLSAQTVRLSQININKQYADGSSDSYGTECTFMIMHSYSHCNKDTKSFWQSACIGVLKGHSFGRTGVSTFWDFLQKRHFYENKINHASKWWITLHCKLHLYETFKFGSLFVS